MSELLSAALLGTARPPGHPAGLPAAIRPQRSAGTRGGPPDGAAVLDELPARGVRASAGRAAARARRDGRPAQSRPRARRRLLRLPSRASSASGCGGARARMRRARSLPRAGRAARRRPARAPRRWPGPRPAVARRANPAWSFLVSAVPGATGDEAGRTATPAAAGVAHRMRAKNPASPMTALSRTLDSGGGGHRAEFLAVLGTGLGDEDEPFLEDALDDRAERGPPEAASYWRGCRTPASPSGWRERARLGAGGEEAVRTGLVVTCPAPGRSCPPRRSRRRARTRNRAAAEDRGHPAPLGAFGNAGAGARLPRRIRLGTSAVW